MRKSIRKLRLSLRMLYAMAFASPSRIFCAFFKKFLYDPKNAGRFSE